jgi:RNA polymerase sigma-70 factor (ECF subfamily)
MCFFVFNETLTRSCSLLVEYLKGRSLSSAAPAASSFDCKTASPKLQSAERAPRRPLERYAFDREYIERLAHGDAETESHFVAYFGELLLIKLRGRLRNPQAAADLRQEVFLRCFRSLRKENGIVHPERIGAYVCSVCENVLHEHFRSDKNTVEIGEGATEPVDGSRSTESELIAEERTQIVKRVLSELAEPDRKLIREVFLEERDKDQICQEMEIDRNYLRVRVHRALARFRSLYKERDSRTRVAGAAV